MKANNKISENKSQQPIAKLIKSDSPYQYNNQSIPAANILLIAITGIHKYKTTFAPTPYFARFFAYMGIADDGVQKKGFVDIQFCDLRAAFKDQISKDWRVGAERVKQARLSILEEVEKEMSEPLDFDRIILNDNDNINQQFVN